MKIVKNQIKKTDAVSALLWVFIFFIIVLFIYLSKVNSYIQNYSMYNNRVHKLESINKDLNSFLLQQASFVNYDIINKKVAKFNEGIEFLNPENSPYALSTKYHKLVRDVDEANREKVTSIEYFKSESAQLVYSMHYLYDLNDAISKSEELNKKSINAANDALLGLMKYSINTNIETTDIVNNLKILDSQDNDFTKMFVRHVEIDLKRIKKFNEIENSQVKDRTLIALEKLHAFINKDYQKNILIEKTIVIVLFAVALIILLILIVMNRRSIAMRDELLGFKTAIENSYNSIVITDVDSNITYVNEIAEKETGYRKDELIGQNPRVLKSGLNDEGFYQELHGALRAGKKWEGEFINKKKDGSLFYEKASIMPIFQHGEIVNYLAIKLNITDYIEEKDKVEYMAYHDALTSLPNRLSIEEYLKNRLPIASRSDSKIAILFIDLDRFKIINDTLGHDVGDELLVEASKRMRSGLRDSDLLARVGGDEFVIVRESPNDSYSAAHVCEKIIQLFHEPVQTTSHSLNITLSIGVSIFPDDDMDYIQLFKYADIAMYEAKEAGKNTYRYYQEALSVEAHKRLDMEQALKVALNNSELYMMYQPKYNIMNHTVVGLEALVRWENEKLGFISPDKFIPIAEDTGFIIEIGLFIFEESCREYLQFKRYSKTLSSISINISAVQLYQDSFIHDVTKIMNKVGIAPSEIVLEITETHIMKNINQSKSLLKSLKDLGFSISIDDFGTGHSSLSYLKLFPIDELKIDKSFVDDLPHDKNDVAISKAIITLSQSMGYVNIAEGIENREQELFMRDNGCLLGQGYHFCRPKRKDDLISFLKK
ncbi:MAG: EAL domain-containing protein [Campylobacterota bacterium]